MIKKLETIEFDYWRIATILAILNLSAFCISIFFIPENIKIQYIPDDAFYYLTLSRNFALLRYWTFDSGISVTSGFHPLFAYLLAVTFSWFQPGTSGFVLSGIALSLFFGAASVFILTLVGFKRKDTIFLMLFAFILSSQNFIFNAISITEWSLTLFLALLYCVYFFYNFRKTFRYREPVFLFFIGFLGSITRADFGFFPFSIAFATGLLFIAKVFSRKQVVFSLAGLIGAIMGLLGVFSHNYLFTAELLQSSAKMKAFWAQSIPLSYFDVVDLYVKIFGTFGFFVLLLIAIRVMIFVLSKLFSETLSLKNISSSYILLLKDSNKQVEILMIVAGSFCLFGYSLVYARNGAIQPWYSSNLIIPFMMFVFGISGFVRSLLAEKTRLFLMLFFLVTFVFNLSVNLYPLGVNNSPWPHQEMMREAGVYLKDNKLSLTDGRIGAWNAGIIGYYQGGQVVNLDGLVNNNIYSYAVNNDLPSYLTDQNIIYIVDFQRMFAEEARRKRGGYNDAAFLQNLALIKTFEDNQTDNWINLSLYQLINP